MNTRDIVKLAGGPTKVARALNFRSHAAVSRWARVPAEHVQTVARMAGLKPGQIRPDVFRKGDVA
jgi:hypothetical protein